MKEKELLVNLVALLSGMLWVSVIAPIAARVLGVPMAIGFWRTDRKDRHLTRSQYLWACGVFGFGVGMFLFNTIEDYLGWRLLGEPSSHLSPLHLIWNLAFAICLGLSFGVYIARYREVSDKNK